MPLLCLLSPLMEQINYNNIYMSFQVGLVGPPYFGEGPKDLPCSIQSSAQSFTPSDSNPTSPTTRNPPIAPSLYFPDVALTDALTIFCNSFFSFWISSTN